ncbi:MAG: cytochrome c3 family protein [Aquificae bacterium]|nr:cytochrome c3 family protein [Aquificota bacterium]
MVRLVLTLVLSVYLVALGKNICLDCHKGIEQIRPPNSQMYKKILELSAKAGYPGNDCIVCHGGNPDGKGFKQIHSGTVKYFLQNGGPKDFYPDPGSPWINKNTCGVCHEKHTQNQFTSLMFTEAGKIQGSLWGFGGINGYSHDIGNYTVKELHQTLGSKVYKQYIEKLKKSQPQVFPSMMRGLPEAPTPEQVEKDPKTAVYTYLRQECLRCHTGVKGRSKRGDYRGLGCSACHIPYSNEGFYEGGDPTIPKEERGHLLIHTIQGTRDAKVKIHGVEYSGIPVETCTTCHDRGKRIGTSFQGLMETAYFSPFTEEGKPQPKLHTKHYLHLKQDIHLRKGMVCQDCHTSLEAHGDGFLAGTTLAAVEIECQDCHGTPEKYPWELPIGYGDEIAGRDNKPRGVVQTLPEYLKQGTVYPKRDGYLLTARGNPFGNVVKDGTDVIVHTAGGKDIRLKPLKKLKEEQKLNKKAYVSMVQVKSHISKMECYTCHATWAPQCYGCHIKIDYSKGVKHPDWIAIGNDHDKSGLTAEARGEIQKHLIDGNIVETRSYLRWEEPPLVINGENRVSPAVPGCQTTITVIGKDGKPLLLNHIFRIPNVEGAKEEGQLAIDMSPIQPHTIQKESRSCESCHDNPKAFGFGIEGGKLFEKPSKGYIVELSTPDGVILPKKYQTQIAPIKNLDYDWSTFLTEEGKQVQTVGHHFTNSKPLSMEQIAKIDRRGVCISCHQTIPEGDLAVSLLTHIAEKTNIKIDNQTHSSLLNKLLLIGAWGQVVGAVLVVSLVGYIYIKRRRAKRDRWY